MILLKRVKSDPEIQKWVRNCMEVCFRDGQEALFV